MDRQFYPVSPQDGRRMAQFGSYEMTASNLNAGLDLARDLSEHWGVNAILRFTHATRDVADNNTESALNQSWNWVSPKLGILWKPSEHFQGFVNLSWHSEAPSFWEIVSNSVAAAMVDIPSRNENGSVEIRAKHSLGIQQLHSSIPPEHPAATCRP